MEASEQSLVEKQDCSSESRRQYIGEGSATSSSSSAPPPPEAAVAGPGGVAQASTSHALITRASCTPLDAVQSANRLGAAGLVPGIALHAVGGIVGLAGLGAGYGVAKLVNGGQRGAFAESTSFRMGCEAFLYANGIFPTVLCEHDDEGYQVGPLPQGGVEQQEFMRTTPLLVANHVSYLDALILPMVLKMPKFMSMSEVEHWPLIGPVGKDLDYIFVDRKSPEARKKALEAVENHVRSWVDGSRPLLIFPEGTTSNGRGLKPFKKGAFVSGVPVRPVVVKYTGAWNPANVNFREAELPDEARTHNESTVDVPYLPYDDGDWALQFAGHLVHSCTVLVCRVYHPSAEEQADPELYAKNVRELMLRKLQELHATCSGAPSSSSLDERLLSLRRRMRMQQLLARGTDGQKGTMCTNLVEAPAGHKLLNPSLWRSPSVSEARRNRLSQRLSLRRSSSCQQSSKLSIAETATTPISAAREKLRQRTEARRSKREATPCAYPAMGPATYPAADPEIVGNFGAAATYQLT